MKLLFDENLSNRLFEALSKEFPGSTHVREVGLASADDRSVWEFARGNGFIIVSKDSDFHQLSFLLGPPPKVAWVRRFDLRGYSYEARMPLLLRTVHNKQLSPEELDRLIEMIKEA